MSRKMMICIASMLTLIVSAQLAHADLITSSADPALAGATVIDFESQALGTYTSITIGDVTFTAATLHLMIDNSQYYTSNMTGKYLDNGTYSNNGFSSMRIDFDGEAATAFGFAWGWAEPFANWSLVAYDASNTVLDTYAPLPNHQQGDAFVGVAAAAGIDHAILSQTAAYDWVAIDNFTYNVVPVPGAILLGILGLSVAGVKLRKFS